MNALRELGVVRFCNFGIAKKRENINVFNNFFIWKTTDSVRILKEYVVFLIIYVGNRI